MPQKIPGSLGDGSPKPSNSLLAAPSTIVPALSDRFIGWTPAVRRRNLHLLAYNTRFLVLPWVQVPHLASHILAQMSRRLSAEWETLYGHPVYYLETFVDRERFAGTCYRAANWVVMGRTAGRGNNCPDKRQNRSIKEVLGYPLTPRFRELLIEG